MQSVTKKQQQKKTPSCAGSMQLQIFLAEIKLLRTRQEVFTLGSLTMALSFLLLRKMEQESELDVVVHWEKNSGSHFSTWQPCYSNLLQWSNCVYFPRKVKEPRVWRKGSYRHTLQVASCMAALYIQYSLWEVGWSWSCPIPSLIGKSLVTFFLSRIDIFCPQNQGLKMSWD